MNNINNKAVVLLQHPTDYPVDGVHFGIQYRSIDTHLNEGDVLRNLYVSVDPYLRGRMIGLIDSYIPSFEIQSLFDSYGISEAVESKNPKLPVGTLVGSVIQCCK
ncbi:hypothetical protein BGX26_001724 [Mortierella sp. AD094]|nr:hypothetical protein BGX26_001724 [Mortierella sp. AD094]